MPNRNLYMLALLLAVGLMIPHASESRVFPGDEWITKSAPDLNIDQGKVDRLFDLSFEDDATQAVVLIKDGYLIGERYAEGFNADSFGTSWSMAKSFYASLIGISIDVTWFRFQKLTLV